MNTISFKILSSPDSGDHEIRILINNDDLLGKEYLGLDPPVFFDQANFLTNGEIMIGRCTCGCEGCSDFPVNVTVDNEKITWTNNHGLRIEFDKVDYEESLHKAKNDHSWEDENRRTERILSDFFTGKKTRDNYLFDWASTRIKNGIITSSLSKNGDQKLFESNWDKSSIESTIKNMKVIFV